MPTRAARPKRNVIPDAIDFRDRIYLPSIVQAPPPRFDGLAELGKERRVPVLHQGETNACTGFALASVVNYLLRRSRSEPDASISAPMLYFTARRYDEFPGSTDDEGSSVRGALKGWFRHGAAAAAVWPNDRLDVPPANPANPQQDWWFDAAKRPLGAYYRVEAKAIADLHVALAEVGILYASAICHDDWFKGSDENRAKKDGIWEIPFRKAKATDGGHAFVIYGYDQSGFLIQNSWGADWGTQGRARLRYEDWLAHAMDCWVVQLGVATDEHLAVAGAGGLRYSRGKVALSSDDVLRNREISPFIVDMENNGELSKSGQFRTSPDDVRSLLEDLVPRARQEWKLPAGKPLDVAIYAHGGLTGEDVAAKTAAAWIPALYEAQVLPIFFFWETGLLKTLTDIAEEALAGQPRPTGGPLQKLDQWWGRRLERLLAGPGTAVWGEMKENAEQISANPQGGARILYQQNAALQPPALSPATARLHLIGHSAGAIVHCHIVDKLAALGWKFESITLMAPAVRRDVFERTILPRLNSGAVRRLLELHLPDAAEQKDPTCRPILGYGRSLLYLVSESFEGGKRTPILGMEKSFDKIAQLGLRNVVARTPADIGSSVSTHGGFDDDSVVREVVIRGIKGEKATGRAVKAARRAR